MPKVELYPSLPRFGYIRIQLAVLHQVGIAICQTVSHNVARTHFLEEELTVASRRKLPLCRHRREVRQDGHSGQAASLNNGIDRRPGQARFTKGSSIVAGFETDDQIAVFLGGIRRQAVP